MTIRTAVYRIWQWTWGFLQSLAGLLIMLYARALGAKSESYRHAVLTRIDGGDKRLRWIGCVSLGMYIFVSAPLKLEGEQPERLQRVIRHEYGHTVQSLILGPLYLIAVGIPSLIWCGYYNSKKAKPLRERGVGYYDRYPEGWATRCGEKAANKPVTRARSL